MSTAQFPIPQSSNFVQHLLPNTNMNRKSFHLSASVFLAAAALVGAESDRSAKKKILISDRSIKVGDTELRTGPASGKGKYISKKAAEKAFGAVGEEYSQGRVIVYAWPRLGVQVQEGLRGSSEG